MPEPRHHITLCMGSSCFARGNAENVQTIEAFISDNGLDASLGGTVELTGTLCKECCTEGPVIVIDGVTHHHVSPAALPGLLAALLRDGN